MTPSRLRNRETRDFAHVDDVTAAFLLALEKPETNGKALNTCSGEDRAIAQVARDLATALNRPRLHVLQGRPMERAHSAQTLQ